MKKVNRLHAILLFLLLFLLVPTDYAGNVTQINRYATVENKPLAAQINPLLATQQVHFNTSIHTVGEALNHWLQFSGFDLVNESEQPASLKNVLSKPLPQVMRDLGPLSVQEGLEVLVGKGIFNLVVDPLNRRVAFKLSPKYAQLTTLKKGTKA
ncbi:hypothetical protein [Legionella fairfieldensis]|uniref:PFGI-1 class ICE element type IV pilus protein PilL2 n=1 Tax=Legionella fairfieldensis TaxID=45064 RepID=UPI00048CFB20|nr:hypothetical protein [Legionella fairfieldensis]